MAKTDPSGESPRSRLHQPPDLDLNEFFRTEDGGRTIVKNSDLEATIPNSEKYHLVEEERYWVNKPYAFVVVYKSQRDQEYRYYLVEPYLTPEEKQLVGFLKDKIRHTLDFQKIRARASERERAITLRETTFELLREYNLISQKTLRDEGKPNPLAKLVNTAIDKLYEHTSAEKMAESGEFAGEDTIELEWGQAQKIVYYIIRDFIRFDRIDGITADNQVEDVSIDGWNSSVFVVHTEYGQMITNVTFGEEDLDEFVTAIAQKAEKGISKRQPNVDATLQDGSRALLMLGDEVTDKGSNFTIRQFNKIPFTPIDLINWQTYSLDQMVYLWLAVENDKSAIVAGGTASGKTTTLNALSMFIPATNKIVSIEDTREIQIPQSNWVPLVTRESFGEKSENRIDEFDLLRDSLRMRPNYVIFGEVRGEEARSLFQNLNTGHTTYATFHAKNSEQVRVRLTTDPINVDETSFGGLDIILNQQEVSISGRSERRAKQIVELREYDASDEKFQIETPFVWNQATDEFEGKLTTPGMESISPLIDEIRHENGWSQEELRDEINRRRVVLSYLLSREMTDYTQVAATLQGYMYSKESVLSAIAEDILVSNTSQFRQMKNINFDVTDTAEENVPRPPVRAEKKTIANKILNEHEDLYMDISVDARYQQPVSELEGETVESPTQPTETSSDEPDTDEEYGYYTPHQNPTETEDDGPVVAGGKTADSPDELSDASADEQDDDNGTVDSPQELPDVSTDEPETDGDTTDSPDELSDASTGEPDDDNETIDSPEDLLGSSSDESETDDEAVEPHEELTDEPETDGDTTDSPDELSDASIGEPDDDNETIDSPEDLLGSSSDESETDDEVVEPHEELTDKPETNDDTTDSPDELSDASTDELETDSETVDSPDELTDTSTDELDDDNETVDSPDELSDTSTDELDDDNETVDSPEDLIGSSSDELDTDYETVEPHGELTDKPETDGDTTDSPDELSDVSTDEPDFDGETVDSSEDLLDPSSDELDTDDEAVEPGEEPNELDTDWETVESSEDPLGPSSDGPDTDGETVDSPEDLLDSSSDELDTDSETADNVDDQMNTSWNTLDVDDETVDNVDDKTDTSWNTLDVDDETADQADDRTDTSTDESSTDDSQGYYPPGQYRTEPEDDDTTGGEEK